MSKYREKKNLRLRRCRIMISHCCEHIFQTKSRRAFACFCCKEFLRTINKTVLEWMKMEKPIMDKETIEWINKEEANMTIESDRDVLDKKTGDVVGSKVEKLTIKTNMKTLLEGNELIRDRLQKHGNQLEKVHLELLELGKPPEKTPEIIRLQKNLINLEKINKCEMIKGKIEPIELQMKMDTEHLKQRQGFIDQAPKD